MTESDSNEPETGAAPADKAGDVRRPRASASRIRNGRRSRPRPHATMFRSPSLRARMFWRLAAAVALPMPPRSRSFWRR